MDVSKQIQAIAQADLLATTMNHQQIKACLEQCNSQVEVAARKL